MFLFLSFVVAIMSMYYLGVMADSYNGDTTYSVPLVALLIYSITNIIREIKEKTTWFFDDDYNNYNRYGNNSNYNYTSGYYRPTNTTTNRYYQVRPTEKVESFIPDRKVNKDDEKLLVHYPTKQEVRDKIKELEKSRWFRIKRKTAAFFGFDITEKYYKASTYNSSEKVKSISSKEDETRFMPPLVSKEREEYNNVAKYVGRSCEIAFYDVEQNDENNE